MKKDSSSLATNEKNREIRNITISELAEMAVFSSQTELKSLFNIYGVFNVINNNSIIVKEITSHEKWIDFLILKNLIDPSNE